MKLQFVASLLSTAALVDAFSTSASKRASSKTRLYERKPFISGNWKLNPQSKDEAVALASGIAGSISESSPDAEVALFVPYVFIESAQSAVSGKLSIGAEGVCPQGNGAYTGAISAPMLNSIGEYGNRDAQEARRRVTSRKEQTRVQDLVRMHTVFLGCSNPHPACNDARCELGTRWTL